MPDEVLGKDTPPRRLPFGDSQTSRHCTPRVECSLLVQQTLFVFTAGAVI